MVVEPHAARRYRAWRAYAPGMPERRLVLFYDYIPDVLERRGPLRPAHLEQVAEWKADGRLVMAGALGDPPTGAALVFREDVDPEEFARTDPYVREGIVTARRVVPWLLV